MSAILLPNNLEQHIIVHFQVTCPHSTIFLLNQKDNINNKSTVIEMELTVVTQTKKVTL